MQVVGSRVCRGRGTHVCALTRTQYMGDNVGQSTIRMHGLYLERSYLVWVRVWVRERERERYSRRRDDDIVIYSAAIIIVLVLAINWVRYRVREIIILNFGLYSRLFISFFSNHYCIRIKVLTFIMMKFDQNENVLCFLIKKICLQLWIITFHNLKLI